MCSADSTSIRDSTGVDLNCAGMPKAAGVFLAMLFASSACAHDTWLRPRTAGGALSVELTAGERFGKPEIAAASEHIARAAYRLRGATFQLGAPKAEERLLRFPLATPDSGIATVWVSLVTRIVDLNDRQVGHYLDEIGASEHVRKAWD